MRSLRDAAFANAFAIVLDASNSGRRLNHWRSGGVEWQRERLSFNGLAFGLQCEVYRISHPSPPVWRLLYVTEIWRDSADREAVRDNRWGRMLEGRMKDAIAWFRMEAETRSL